MQPVRGKAEALGRKAKLAHSYQELLDEFSNKDLKSVGNYTLGRLIGKGSFGKVYLATHKLTNGSKVVLKSAKKGDSNLAREIHHHRQFVHPHIARLYEVIVTETLVWLVLEYCPGDELYNYLVQHGKLPVDKVQRIFTQLVGAVSYVHQQSCVHRDLKLENILLDKHENVKLCDFGFTREYEGKANHLQTFCGTICYSAPEMLKGEKYAGEKVDVWSLGVILYALLTGELPFDDDDDAVTRNLILTKEPKYPEHIPADALTLLKRLLSKRPLLRPSLPDILSHPFLSEHAPQQQAILKLERPPPFATSLEKDTLQRMRSAGVDIDSVIESVLSQRCDALAGWWTLLIEKEERKAQRRERKRKEKEAENRVSRRFSQASSRMEKLATVGEESAFGKAAEPPLPTTRGRPERRSGHYPGLVVTDLPALAYLAKANGNLSPDAETPPPPPIDKDSIRSASSSRHRRPIPPPKEGVLRSARSRGSILHLVTTTDALGGKAAVPMPMSQQKVRKKTSQVIVAHWKNWTHWLFERPKRNKGTAKTGSQSTPNLVDKSGNAAGKDSKSKDSSPRPQTSKYPAGNSGTNVNTAGLPKGMVANGYAGKGTSTSPIADSMQTSNAATGLPTFSYFGQAANVRTTTTSTSHKRLSLSPSPITPRGTVRRSSGPGLRGRKSTSSSVSSIRSMHHAHHHSHSKASSTSSNGSVSTSMSKTPLPGGRSPHHSVKVLPATPTTTSFPSNIRLVRDRAGPPLSVFNEGMPGNGPGTSSMQPPGSPNPFSSAGGGILFAKRKRNIFKGPMLSLGSSGASRDTRSSGSGSAGHSRNASATGLGRRSGEITIEEVDEDEDEGDGDVEEVDTFSPIVQFPGEMVEEKIYEEGEEESPGTTAPPVPTPVTPAR
ncbi:kinase-like protein [Coniochaeta ligniaria NRRL 30616]|uniref:Kinase-like protein n=1 Tax=Coniochaeta ligniaria NRRL 30616 TaxID=1408157 RepID=A0A1J7J0E6_9PEZI|nr:kinase-like protein [Coniochaeta ligniaria NRRL 30616]